ncbi:4Fe-4S dicluster domain-containing protein [Desulfosporosinus sp. FKA]|uniref:4Fe-4S dicluster domain-containing protein n=1 Tax=Desulfosporosinus sp. FKA TaxID=1969834 RepID=UPI000B49A5B4|nr:4Fe-4S dicluster domain-containing protein [Desulfosporosinus sp. FKA]
MTKRWGMAIDQSRCVGCWTCAIACKSINNEPLGIFWNRVLTCTPNENALTAAPAATAIDVPHGTFPDLELAYQPTACQHCNNAPCQKVCPVGATFRREDGVILVDFERCIGCRFCMAACPYGVRVFNWEKGKYAPDFPVGYGRDYRTEGRLVFTPERPVGVAEKCTFCVERLDNGQQPMCAASCPAGARIFGDLNDPQSDVSVAVREQGGRQLLGDLGTDPNIFYLPVARPNKMKA